MNRTAPWLSGIIESLKCVALIRSSILSSRNRLSLLMLDSTLEISLRQYLQNIKRITLDPEKHRRRHILFDIAKNNIDAPSEIWDHLNYFWNTRNPQYHQDANIIVTDIVYQEFADLVSFMLNKMFGIDSKQYLEFPIGKLISAGNQDSIQIDFKRVKSKVDAIIASVAVSEIVTSKDVRKVLKQLGLGSRFKFSEGEIRSYFSQKYFYKDERGIRKLSLPGGERLRQIIINRNDKIKEVII